MNDDLAEFNNVLGCCRTLALYLILVALIFGAFFWWAGW